MDTKPADLRVSIPRDMKAAWDAMLEERRISAVDAVAALLGWLTTQTPMVQSLVLGQVPSENRSDVAQMVLTKMIEDGPQPRYQTLNHRVGTPAGKKKGK